MGNKKEFLEALDHVQELYPNMAVLSQLSKLLKSPNSDLDSLARLIRTEAALTLDVIRVSNSPVFVRAEKCRDIQTAVAWIGYNEVQRVVGLVLARQFCSRDLNKYSISAHDYWAETVTVSVLMEGLARALGEDAAEAATVGLLFAIGKVVINNILTDFEIDVLWDNFLPLAQWERAMVGFDYAQAGARLLGRWEFPREMTYSIGFHLEPKRAPKRLPLLSMLHYAVRLCEKVGTGCEERDYAVPIYPPVTDQITNAEVRRLVEEARDSFLRTAQMILTE
ncbi:MAG: HDOD domain-containing protein [Verrucomicrobiota bacterium]